MPAKEPSILHEDEALIVLDKPTGMLTIPTPRGETNTLSDWINRHLDERGIEVNAYPCHRIDRETSGLVLYAKGKSLQQKVMEAFKERQVRKQYFALAHGQVRGKSGKIEKPIYNRNKRRSEKALTLYRSLGRTVDFTALEVSPVTGRTNQIRIHFAEIGHPLVGESVFAFRRDFKLKFKRVALHAWKLMLKHPVTGERVTFEAPVPDDLRTLWPGKQ